MNFPAILRLRGEFEAEHGIKPTHLFVRDYDFAGCAGKPYGLIMVEVQELTTDFAVGIIHPNPHNHEQK